jgi:hypothetical protein
MIVSFALVKVGHCQTPYAVNKKPLQKWWGFLRWAVGEVLALERRRLRRHADRVPAR